MQKIIYFVEDDPTVNLLIQETLNENNFEAVGFFDPLVFLKKMESLRPDLIILDIMLPNMNGYDVIKILKNNKNYEEIPVIMLTAKSSELDIVQGLDMGASDYITKPFGLLEFISRINVNLRKVSMTQDKILTCRDLTLNSVQHKVYFKGKPIEFTAKEYDILELLMQNVSIVVTRKQLLKKIWGFDFQPKHELLICISK